MELCAHAPYAYLASSIGMSKAALEAINGMNLYGLKGAHWSSVFIDVDAHYRNRSTIDNLLPRESASKVTSRPRQQTGVMTACSPRSSA